MARKDESNTKPDKSSRRTARLAAALRENLRRRKVQERQRGAALPSGAPAKPDK